MKHKGTVLKILWHEKIDIFVITIIVYQSNKFNNNEVKTSKKYLQKMLYRKSLK